MNSVTQKEENKERKDKIIATLANDHGVKVLNFEFLTSQWRKKKCCSGEERLLIYQKEDRSLGKMRFCCENKLATETQRVSKLLQKVEKNSSTVYGTAYKLIRGSVGQVLLQASFGINTRIYARENVLVREHSILRNISYLLESCSMEEWNLAVENFQRFPSEKSVEKIVKLYSPLFRDDGLLVSKMAKELVVFLENTLRKWRGMKKRVVYGHLGAGVVINDILVSLKFTEHKLGFQKTYFESLYRNYHSICRANHDEKKKIRKLAVFSPVTNELVELEIREAVVRWKLERDFNRNFTLWQLKNYISLSKSNIFIADRVERGAELAIETSNPLFKRLEITQKNEE